MDRFRTLAVLSLLGLCFLSAVYATSPAVIEQPAVDNSYHVFTKSLKVDDSGVCPIPSRFKWSVETCVAGFDLRGNELSDPRVMLRLYDPDHNFTAITAQMSLETAEDLQRQLVEIIAKKRDNPNYQHRPKLYDHSKIPTATITEVDNAGVAAIKHERN